MQASESSNSTSNHHKFTGNIFIFYAYDVGDDIDLKRIEEKRAIDTLPLQAAKYLRYYHTPLAVELPHPHTSSKCLDSKILSFGVISLAYKIPFQDTLENIRKNLNELDAEFQEQSVTDAHSIFKKIKKYIKQPRFFHLKSWYVVIQVDPIESISPATLKEQYGGIIASSLRFETESLSEYKKNEILEDARGYYRGDLIVVDTDAAFVYDDEYKEILDLFEFANIQNLELQYYDQALDKQLDFVYQRQVRTLPIKAYLPFIGTRMKDPISALGLLKVDIQSIIERLDRSIKLAGESYTSEIYTLLVEKLDLDNWKASIDNKLEIIKDIYTVYQDKIDTIREDLLSVLIIVLIFIELIIGILNYLKT